MEEAKNDIIYQKELFDRLKKSVGLKKEEECIGCMIQPAAWWIIEKANPRLDDLRKLVSCDCPHYKKTSKDKKDADCIKLIFNVVNKARAAKAQDAAERRKLTQEAQDVAADLAKVKQAV